jgi:hypothetical protein
VVPDPLPHAARGGAERRRLAGRREAASGDKPDGEADEARDDARIAHVGDDDRSARGSEPGDPVRDTRRPVSGQVGHVQQRAGIDEDEADPEFGHFGGLRHERSGPDRGQHAFDPAPGPEPRLPGLPEDE